MEGYVKMRVVPAVGLIKTLLISPVQNIIRNSFAASKVTLAAMVPQVNINSLMVQYRKEFYGI